MLALYVSFALSIFFYKPFIQNFDLVRIRIMINQQVITTVDDKLFKKASPKLWFQSMLAYTVFYGGIIQ